MPRASKLGRRKMTRESESERERERECERERDQEICWSNCQREIWSQFQFDSVKVGGGCARQQQQQRWWLLLGHSRSCARAHARAHSHAIARGCTHASKKLNNPRALFLARASSIFFHLSETFHGFSIERTNGDNFRKTTTRLKPKSSEFERNGSNENLRRT